MVAVGRRQNIWMPPGRLSYAIGLDMTRRDLQGRKPNRSRTVGRSAPTVDQSAPMDRHTSHRSRRDRKGNCDHAR